MNIKLASFGGKIYETTCLEGKVFYWCKFSIKWLEVPHLQNFKYEE